MELSDEQRDNALDLLYPSAREELRDLTDRPDPGRVDAADALHARFYRFLDSHGAVIVPQVLLDLHPVHVGNAHVYLPLGRATLSPSSIRPTGDVTGLPRTFGPSASPQIWLGQRLLCTGPEPRPCSACQH